MLESTMQDVRDMPLAEAAAADVIARLVPAVPVPAFNSAI
jgi:hypothetical protein